MCGSPLATVRVKPVGELETPFVFSSDAKCIGDDPVAPDQERGHY